MTLHDEASFELGYKGTLTGYDTRLLVCETNQLQNACVNVSIRSRKWRTAIPLRGRNLSMMSTMREICFAGVHECLETCLVAFPVVLRLLIEEQCSEGMLGVGMRHGSSGTKGSRPRRFRYRPGERECHAIVGLEEQLAL